MGALREALAERGEGGKVAETQGAWCATQEGELRVKARSGRAQIQGSTCKRAGGWVGVVEGGGDGVRCWGAKGVCGLVSNGELRRGLKPHVCIRGKVRGRWRRSSHAPENEGLTRARSRELRGFSPALTSTI
jgi:hypothetical protein